MNIFEILSQGKGSVNEENVSAFLAYLLNPNETHGLKNEFFKEFIKLVDKKLVADDTLQFSNIRLEVPFYDESSKNNKRVIDIFLEVHSAIRGDIIIAIENKIDSSAIQKEQLKEECEYILNTYNNYPAQKFKFIFLTPKDCENSPKLPQEPSKEQCDYHHIFWSQVTDSLKNLLQKEQDCEISPLSDYVRHTLKSFVLYINNLGKRYLKVAAEFELYQNGSLKKYCLKQYSNYQAELYELENNKCKLIQVYGVLYEFVSSVFPEIKEKNINTQYLADKMLKYLKDDPYQKELKGWNRKQANKS